MTCGRSHHGTASRFRLWLRACAGRLRHTATSGGGYLVRCWTSRRSVVISHRPMGCDVGLTPIDPRKATIQTLRPTGCGIGPDLIGPHDGVPILAVDLRWSIPTAGLGMRSGCGLRGDPVASSCWRTAPVGPRPMGPMIALVTTSYRRSGRATEKRNRRSPGIPVLWTSRLPCGRFAPAEYGRWRRSRRKPMLPR